MMASKEMIMDKELQACSTIREERETERERVKFCKSNEKLYQISFGSVIFYFVLWTIWKQLNSDQGSRTRRTIQFR